MEKNAIECSNCETPIPKLNKKVKKDYAKLKRNIKKALLVFAIGIVIFIFTKIIIYSNYENFAKKTLEKKYNDNFETFELVSTAPCYNCMDPAMGCDGGNPSCIKRKKCLQYKYKAISSKNNKHYYAYIYKEGINVKIRENIKNNKETYSNIENLYEIIGDDYKINFISDDAFASEEYDYKENETYYDEDPKSKDVKITINKGLVNEINKEYLQQLKKTSTKLKNQNMDIYLFYQDNYKIQLNEYGIEILYNNDNIVTYQFEENNYTWQEDVIEKINYYENYMINKEVMYNE